MIFSFSLKTFFRKRRTAALSVLIFVLSVSLLCAALNIIFSLVSSVNNRISYVYGDYSFLEPYEGEAAPSPGTPIYARTGSIVCEGSVYDGQLNVGFASPEAETLLPLRLLDGQLPSKDGEIAVENTLGYKINMQISVGSRIVLEEKSVSGGISENQYTVVGILDGVSSLSGADGSGRDFLPSALVCADAAREAEYYVVRTGKTDDEQKAFLVNPRYTEQSGAVYLAESAKILVPVAVAGISLVSLFIFVSYMKIGGAEVFARVGYLREMGSPHRALYSFTFLRCSFVAITSLTLSLPLSLLFVYLWERQVSDFIKIYRSLPVVPSALAATALMFLLNAAVYHIRLTGQLKRRPYYGRGKSPQPDREKRPRDILSNLYFPRSGGSFSGIIVSLAAMLCVALAATFFAQTIRGEFSVKYSDDCTVRTLGSGYVTSLYAPVEPRYGVTGAQLDELLSTGEISDIVTVRSLDVAVQSDIPLKEKYFMSRFSAQTEAEETEYLSERFGIDADKYYYCLPIKEFNDSFIETASREIGFEVPSSEGGNANAVYVCRDKNASPFLPGDSVTVVQIINDDPLDFSLKKSHVVKIVITVSSVVEIFTAETYTEKKLAPSFSYFLLGEGTFEKLGLDLGFSAVYINFRNPSEHSRTDAVLNRMKSVLTGSSFRLQSDVDAERKYTLSTVLVTAASVIAVTFISSVLLYGSVLALRYRSDGRKWGILRSLGLKRGDAAVRQTGETILIYLISCLACAALIAFGLILNVRKDATLVNGPFIAVAAAAGAVLVAVSVLAVLRAFRCTAAEQIRDLKQ